MQAYNWLNGPFWNTDRADIQLSNDSLQNENHVDVQLIKQSPSKHISCMLLICLVLVYASCHLKNAGKHFLTIVLFSLEDNSPNRFKYIKIKSQCNRQNNVSNRAE